MKHFKNSIVVVVAVIAVMGVVTFFVPSRTKGMSPGVSKEAPSAFSVASVTSAGELVGPDPEGTSYAVTSLTVTNLNIDSVRVNMRALWGNTTDCEIFPLGEFQTSDGPSVVVPGRSTVHLSFPQPFILSAKPGPTSCLRVDPSGVTTIGYSVVGYRF